MKRIALGLALAAISIAPALAGGTGGALDDSGSLLIQVIGIAISKIISLL